MRLFGIGVAREVDRRGAHRGFAVFETVAESFGRAVEGSAGFGRDLGADAVAGKQSNAQVHGFQCVFQRFSRVCSNSRMHSERLTR